MQDFSAAYGTFLTAFTGFVGNTYPGGIDCRKEKLSAITGSLPLDDPECRETNLFLWIVKASILLTDGGVLPADRVLDTVRQIGTVLAAKNADYGNSAREPSPFFAGSLSPADCILVRIGDKIARADHLADGVSRQVADESPADTVRDFIGYAILLYITLFVDGAELHADPAQGGPDRAALFIPRPMTYRELAGLVKRGDFEIYLPANVEQEDA